MKTYFVQAIYGFQFEDLEVRAESPEAAIAIARQITTLRSRWTKFVI